jgi:hypothetical protein
MHELPVWTAFIPAAHGFHFGRRAQVAATVRSAEFSGWPRRLNADGQRGWVCTRVAPWHDPSPHRVQFVRVEDGVKLEVLDWGGSGRPVVLLAGSGDTAHVVDDFAPKLSAFCRVLGITRRGCGISSHPDSGYSEQRLADDVLRVLDALKLVQPVLIGHSMSGEELTRLGDHSDRLAGLVYLDAASAPPIGRAAVRRTGRFSINCLSPCASSRAAGCSVEIVSCVLRVATPEP